MSFYYRQLYDSRLFKCVFVENFNLFIYAHLWSKHESYMFFQKAKYKQTTRINKNKKRNPSQDQQITI